MDAYDDYHRQIATEAHGSKDLEPAREMEAAFEALERLNRCNGQHGIWITPKALEAEREAIATIRAHIHAKNTELDRLRREVARDEQRAEEMQGMRADARADVERLREREAKLKRELTYSRDNNHKRNLELDALHYVWCDGGCYGGVHRYDGKGVEGITEEVVELAERNTKRLRTWFENFKFRQEARRLLGEDEK